MATAQTPLDNRSDRTATNPAGRQAMPALVLLLITFVALSTYLYWKALQWWYMEWTMEGSYYAHGVFIPFFVAAMIWRDREQLRRLPVGRSWWGLVPILLAIVLVYYAYRADISATLSVSFMLFLIGSAYVVAGKAIARKLLLPLLFLLTMIPIFPNQVINKAAFPIQLTSAKMAATSLNMLGFSAKREGTQIQVEDYTLNVEVPCSGFKTLVGMMAFAGAFAYLVEAAKWKRWFLFLISIPLAVLVNGVRITLIGLVGAIFSAAAASTFHDWSGLIVLIVGFTILFAMARWLKCQSFMGIPLQDPPDGRETVTIARAVVDAPPADPGLDQRFGPRRSDAIPRISQGLYSVVGLLAVACVLRYNTRPLESHMTLLDTKDIPRTFANGGWVQLGPDVPITKDVQDILQPEAYVERNYLGEYPKTGAINLFITGGSSRRTFHDPHECFVGSGYIMHDQAVRTIDTAAGPVRVQETIAENGRDGTKSLLMYLYMVDGKQTQSMGAVHLNIMEQAFFGSSGHPFYFVRFRQMANGTDDVRRNELIDFIKGVWPFIAPKVQAGPTPARTAER